LLEETAKAEFDRTGAGIFDRARRAAVFGDKEPRELLGEVRGHGRNVNAPEGECESAACPDCWRGGRIAAIAR